MRYRNPVIAGFNPDPSICRAGDDFYLVTSTFEYFPGVPIYHSKNLVNWELIGHCLDDKELLDLTDCNASSGIYAPTIRYHDGTFFMVTTNKSQGGNFVIHTDDINGKWSRPAWIDPNGIDPSLFWDDDGKCYYCSTYRVDGKRATVCYQIDPFTGERLSDMHDLGTGCGGRCPEAPHIYKVGGMYYLTFAEGGTGTSHRVTIHRADSVFGPYMVYDKNPILTHMDRKGDEINATGHADLIEDQNGNWWMVFLGVRNYSGKLHSNLGRETFLSPVKWTDDGWPVVGHGGYITYEMEGELPAPAWPTNNSFELDMRKLPFDNRLFYLRNPIPENYSLDTDAGLLTLNGAESICTPLSRPTLLAIRQPGFYNDVSALIKTAACSAKRCGIGAYRAHNYHYEAYVASRDDGSRYVGFAKHVHDIFVELACVPVVSDEDVTLYISTDRAKYSFAFSIGEGEKQPLGSGLNIGLAGEAALNSGFTGAVFIVFSETGKGVFSSYKLEAHEDIGIQAYEG